MMLCVQAVRAATEVEGGRGAVCAVWDAFRCSAPVKDGDGTDFPCVGSFGSVPVACGAGDGIPERSRPPAENTTGRCAVPNPPDGRMRRRKEALRC